MLFICPGDGFVLQQFFQGSYRTLVAQFSEYVCSHPSAMTDARIQILYDRFERPWVVEPSQRIPKSLPGLSSRACRSGSTIPGSGSLDCQMLNAACMRRFGSFMPGAILHDPSFTIRSKTCREFDDTSFSVSRVPAMHDNNGSTTLVVPLNPVHLPGSLR